MVSKPVTRPKYSCQEYFWRSSFADFVLVSIFPFLELFGDEKDTKVHHVRIGGTGDQQIAESFKKVIGVVV
jgi:hypothetical protein